MSSSFSPSRSLGSSRLQLGGVGGVSRLRSSSLKKLPEPQGRAVADCLSSSAAASGTSAATPHHGRPSAAFLSEASRNLLVRNLCEFESDLVGGCVDRCNGF
ncbi:hypothetical protein FH972_005276 [Carpinus fangiana]|uniref:Uncharacterized protein n=1 Tax=Carpinus fangiana TaxID=176857 RepID=A0A5N6QNS7_9ROSI|nr:hypothetical protein FH972_005276 [Carpinus fangiana]